MGSVHARGDTFLTFGLKALTETNTSRLATAFIPREEYRLRVFDSSILRRKFGPKNEEK
jgi:hypothetical protein